MAKVPGMRRKIGQQWLSKLECLDCGQTYLHSEMSPDPSDEPDHEVPFGCEDCGGQLIRLSVDQRTIKYDSGSRLDRLD